MQEILKEYLLPDRIVRRKETAVLILSDAVTAAIIHLLAADKTRNLDYDKIIDSVFKIKLDSGVLSQCLISMKEITQMKKIFKEEKLYYDFTLRMKRRPLIPSMWNRPWRPWPGRCWRRRTVPMRYR